LTVLLAWLLPTLLTACGPAPAPQAQAPDPGDCLNAVAIDQLDGAIARCDKVLAAHPFDPEPLNDRALLLSLAHRQGASCRDTAKAAALLAKLTPGQAVGSHHGPGDPGARRQLQQPGGQPFNRRTALSPILQQSLNHGGKALALQLQRPPLQQQGNAFRLAGNQAIHQLVGHPEL
jgi:hypothetical protein